MVSFTLGHLSSFSNFTAVDAMVASFIGQCTDVGAVHFSKNIVISRVFLPEESAGAMTIFCMISVILLSLGILASGNKIHKPSL